jgi:hypothetical protein
MTEERAEKFIQEVIALLLRSKRTERSNSARARLWRAVHGAIARNRRNRTARYALQFLAPTGPFDENEIRFRNCVTGVASCLTGIPGIAEDIKEILDREVTERLIEEVQSALEKQDADSIFAELLHAFSAQHAGTKRRWTEAGLREFNQQNARAIASRFASRPGLYGR